MKQQNKSKRRKCISMITLAFSRLKRTAFPLFAIFVHFIYAFSKYPFGENLNTLHTTLVFLFCFGFWFLKAVKSWQAVTPGSLIRIFPTSPTVPATAITKEKQNTLARPQPRPRLACGLEHATLLCALTLQTQKSTQS